MNLSKLLILRCLVVFGALFLGWFLGETDCFAQSEKRVGVLVSQRIRPYMLVLEGINNGLSGQNIDLAPYYLGNPKTVNETQEALKKTGYDLLVGIGPEAMEEVRTRNVPGIYSAVLTPHPDSSCGVSLQIPVKIQLQEIAATFPAIKRVGLLFDPRHNEFFYAQAKKTAYLLNISLVPIRVPATEMVSTVLREHWEQIDCLWIIPDPTIISESLVQYIIKQALFQKKGVIGYNPFFIQSGALFAFEFDYQKLGEQTARKILDYLFLGECSKESPVFRTVVNKKIAGKLGIDWEGEVP